MISRSIDDVIRRARRTGGRQTHARGEQFCGAYPHRQYRTGSEGTGVSHGDGGEHESSMVLAIQRVNSKKPSHLRVKYLEPPVFDEIA
jgi:hypothetical protein